MTIEVISDAQLHPTRVRDRGQRQAGRPAVRGPGAGRLSGPRAVPSVLPSASPAWRRSRATWPTPAWSRTWSPAATP